MRPIVVEALREPLLVVSLLMSACAAGGGGDDDSGSSGEAKGTITVTSLWGGVEQEAFQKMLDAFKAKTGITATYESQRDEYATVLAVELDGELDLYQGAGRD